MTEAVRPGAAITDGVHVLPVRVYFEDTDAAGIVYHANYLQFAERARTEMLRTVGIDHRTLAAESRVAFAVRRCDAEFVKPARLDDWIEVHSHVTHVGGATVGIEQVIRRDGVDLVRMRLRIACMSLAGRAARFPAAVRSALADFQDATTGPE